MGLKDRLKAAKQYLTTPLTLSMLEQGSDLRAFVGQPARVVVVVEGEDDGTVERIDLMLRRPATGTDAGGYQDIVLGQVPTVAGRHELMVTMPPGTVPSAIGFGNDYFRAALVRTKGVESDAYSPVAVVGRAEDLYWPDDHLAGVDGPTEVKIDLVLGSRTADIGGAVVGEVTVQALADLPQAAVEIEVTAVVTAYAKAVVSDNRLELRTAEKVAVRQSLSAPLPLGTGQRLDLPFTVAVPAGLPPTLRIGESSVVWQVRVRRGDSSAWALVGMLDPDSLSAPPKEQGPTLASLFF